MGANARARGRGGGSRPVSTVTFPPRTVAKNKNVGHRPRQNGIASKPFAKTKTEETHECEGPERKARNARKTRKEKGKWEKAWAFPLNTPPVSHGRNKPFDSTNNGQGIPPETAHRLCHMSPINHVIETAMGTGEPETSQRPTRGLYNHGQLITKAKMGKELPSANRISIYPRTPLTSFASY